LARWPGCSGIRTDAGRYAYADAVRAARQLKVVWEPTTALPGSDKVYERMRATKTPEEIVVQRGGQTITLNPNTFLVWTGKSFSIGSVNITYGVVLMILLYLIAAYALRYTAWGRHLYATGDDQEAARLAGINTKRVLFSAYAVAGVVIAVAAWILIGRVNGADTNSGINANLESITAVVIGGTSLFGGRGVVIGSLIGALIVQVFENGLALAGVDANYQVFAIGVLVIVAVSLDQWIRRVKA
jgi:fructose transport system permease protein